MLRIVNSVLAEADLIEIWLYTAEAPPLKTALYTLRLGLVKFIVPFAFAFYPVLLIVEESGVSFNFGDFVSAVIRLMMVIYLVSSATLPIDQKHLAAWEIALRLVLAVCVLHISVMLHWVAFVASLLLIIWHNVRAKQ